GRPAVRLLRRAAGPAGGGSHPGAAAAHARALPRQRPVRGRPRRRCLDRSRRPGTAGRNGRRRARARRGRARIAGRARRRSRGTASVTHRQLPLALRFPQGARFDRYAPDGNEAVVAALRAFAESPAAPGALLVGASGTGKTHLAMAVVAAATDATLLPLAELGGRAEAALAATQARSLVVLDDVDAIAGRRNAEVALFDLFNRTRDAGGALLVTAPANVPRLALVLPDLASRLASLSL